MNRRSSAPKAAVRRPLSTALAAVAMAMSLCAFPIANAHAEPGKCAPGQAICLGPQPEPTQEPAPSQPPAEAPKPAPAEPQPVPTVPPQPTVAPVAPVAPAPPVVPAEAPSPTATEAPTPSNTPTPIPSSAAPSTSAPPSTESNWNKPIQETAKAKQAAVVVGKGGPPANMFALFAIMGGVLLVGLGGLAFALWSRNKLSSH